MKARRDQARLEERERGARRREEAPKEEKERTARVERTLEEKGPTKEHEGAGGR